MLLFFRLSMQCSCRIPCDAVMRLALPSPLLPAIVACCLLCCLFLVSCRLSLVIYLSFLVVCHYRMPLSSFFLSFVTIVCPCHRSCCVWNYLGTRYLVPWRRYRIRADTIRLAGFGVRDTVYFRWNCGTRDQAFQVALVHIYSTLGSTPKWNKSDIRSQIRHYIAPYIGGRMSLGTAIQKNTTTVEFYGYCTSITVLCNPEIHRSWWYFGYAKVRTY